MSATPANPTDPHTGPRMLALYGHPFSSYTQKVLTANLREMEAQGLLSRKVYAEVPPRVEYTLTDLGYSLKPVLDAMCSWGERYKASVAR